MKAADGDISEIKTEFGFTAQKLKAKESALKDFCEQTNLHRDRYREQVFAVDTEKKIANFGRSTSSKAVWANKKALTKQKENDIIKIHQGRQDKHIRGTNNYTEGRSYLTISNKEIKNTIKTKSGTGMKVGNKEQIVADKIIGVNVNTKHGFKTLTDTAYIHSSKDGSHLVPTYSQLRTKSIPQLKVYCKKMAMECYDTPEYIKFTGKLTVQEKERRIDLLLSQKQSKTSLIKDIKSMEKIILKSRGDIK